MLSNSSSKDLKQPSSQTVTFRLVVVLTAVLVLAAVARLWGWEISITEWTR